MSKSSHTVVELQFKLYSVEDIHFGPKHYNILGKMKELSSQCRSINFGSGNILTGCISFIKKTN